MSAIDNISRKETFKRLSTEAFMSVKYASEFLNELCRIMESFQLYDEYHQVTREGGEVLLKKLRALFSFRRVVTIDVSFRRFLVMNQPIYETTKAAGAYHQYLREAGIGGLTFIEGTTVAEIITFMKLTSEGMSMRLDRTELDRRLKDAEIQRISFELPLVNQEKIKYATDDDIAGEGALSEKLFKATMDTGEKREIKTARKIYQVAVGLIKDMMHKAAQPDQVVERDVSAVAEDLVEFLVNEKDDLIALAVSGRIDDYPYIHPVNVAIFACVLGEPIIKDGITLIELAKSALLYDLGKSYVSPAILFKPDVLTENEQKEVRRHPVIAANMLDRVASLEKMAVTVAYEHHLGESEKEYPQRNGNWEINFATYLIKVAESFDAMIGATPYRKPTSPEVAMQRLLTEAPSALEKALAARLIRTIGLFPVGTLVTLTTGEIGVVIKQEKGKILSPTVRMVVDAEGKIMERPVDVQVSKKRDREISRAIRPGGTPIDPLQYFPFWRQ